MLQRLQGYKGKREKAKEKALNILDNSNRICYYIFVDKSTSFKNVKNVKNGEINDEIDNRFRFGYP